MRIPESYWSQGAVDVTGGEVGSYVVFENRLERIIRRLIQYGRFNTFLEDWDDDRFTHRMSRYRLKFVLFKSIITGIGQRITALDLWHPLEYENVPDWCERRSELLGVHTQGLEIIARVCSKLRHIALCSCVMMFEEEKLQTIMHKNMIDTLYLRGTMKTLSFLDFLPTRLRLLHLEMPSVDHPLLFTKISRFVAIDNFVLRYRVEADWTPYYSPEVYMIKCSTVDISEEVDVKAACRI